MQIDFTSDGTQLTASFTGELDHHTSAEAREKVDTMLSFGIYNHLIFDFSGLSFMDSSGIAVIMGRYTRLCALGGKVSVITSNPRITRILRLSGIEKYVLLEEKGGNTNEGI